MEGSRRGVRDGIIADDLVSSEDSSGIQNHRITGDPVLREDLRSSWSSHSISGFGIGYIDFLGDDSSIYYQTTNSCDRSSSENGSIQESSNHFVEPNHSTAGSSQSSGFSVSTENSYQSALIDGPSASTSSRLVRTSDLTSERGSNPFILRDLLFKEFTWESVLQMTNNMEVILGKGSFGCVYKGTLPNTVPVAVKIPATSNQGHRQFFNEVMLLSRLNHVNLVRLLGCCKEHGNRALIYEYVEGGTLLEHLHGGRPSLGWKTRLSIALGSARGFEYLHFGCSPNIIHRDIKPANILLGKNLVAKVADFGLSKLMRNEDENSHQTNSSTYAVGTGGYMDLEYYQTGIATPEIDVYSFGIVLLEIVTGRQVNADGILIKNWVKTQMETVGLKGVIDRKLARGYNKKSATTVINLAFKCAKDSSNDRPDFREVVKTLEVAVGEASTNARTSLWYK